MMDGLVVLCIWCLFVTYECCKGKHTFPLLHTILILLSCKVCDISKHHLYWKHDMQVILTIVMHTVVVCHGHHLRCNMFLLQLVWLVWQLCCYCLHCVEPILYWWQMYMPCCEDDFSWWKNYGTYSLFYSISYIILSFFLKTKSSVSPTDFTDFSLIGLNGMWTFRDKADGQTHVCCHCIVVVVLWVFATAHLQCP